MTGGSDAGDGQRYDDLPPLPDETTKKMTIGVMISLRSVGIACLEPYSSGKRPS